MELMESALPVGVLRKAERGLDGQGRPRVVAGSDANLAPKYLREMAWARIADFESDFKHGRVCLAQKLTVNPQ